MCTGNRFFVGNSQTSFELTLPPSFLMFLSDSVMYCSSQRAFYRLGSAPSVASIRPITSLAPTGLSELFELKGRRGLQLWNTNNLSFSLPLPLSLTVHRSFSFYFIIFPSFSLHSLSLTVSNSLPPPLPPCFPLTLV